MHAGIIVVAAEGGKEGKREGRKDERTKGRKKGKRKERKKKERRKIDQPGSRISSPNIFINKRSIAYKQGR
jgi:hypothetical protein